ncbi:fasciclin domain-containing protein [Aestuariibaculum suncheonense]|uniref:Fasciclin domain-containing protein n=1 Tax=Aestuariibaculum suncheonense TaxID=1028745 RepID=A0A8J6QFS3_9FLAO|nr:fasciclin domain-containing protein [Aestuariibaculum suncheonense]
MQETFDFKPEVSLVDPFEDITAWDFIQTRTALNEEGGLSGEELNYFIAAIKKAGFEDLYDQTETQERTYFLLNNRAFIGAGNVIQIVTGSSSVAEGETPEQVMERVDTPEKMEKLRAVLKYHIVTSYVAQLSLAERDVPYLFQTLIPGDDGLIALTRNDRWNININTNPAPLPPTALSQPEGVYRANYVFKNGIGHFIQDPVRNKPY